MSTTRSEADGHHPMTFHKADAWALEKRSVHRKNQQPARDVVRSKEPARNETRFIGLCCSAGGMPAQIDPNIVHHLFADWRHSLSCDDKVDQLTSMEIITGSSHGAGQG